MPAIRKTRMQSRAARSKSQEHAQDVEAVAETVSGAEGSPAHRDKQRQSEFEALAHPEPAFLAIGNAPVTATPTEHWATGLLAESGENSVIRLMWPELIILVKVTASMFPSGFPWEKLSHATQSKISSWASDPAKYISGNAIGSGRRFFEAWIHRFLYDNLFSPACEDKWWGEEWHHFGKAFISTRGQVDRTHLEESILFHNARRLHAHYLIRRYGPHTDLERLRRLFYREFGFILSANSTPIHVVKKTVNEMTLEAVRIDMCLIAAHRDIAVEFWDPASGCVKDFPFDEQSGDMEYDHFIEHPYPTGPLDGRLVAFISKPRLTVHGIVVNFSCTPHPDWDELDPSDIYFAFRTLGAMPDVPGYAFQELAKPLGVIVASTRDEAEAMKAVGKEE
ncbi:hypothetical protein B0I35DRAFT_477333 [Stachybotrys elegans]|uniref:Uncharacterized protein n=1 Tax=Stachybotrys elegans TaxID=80388 RepID=A0A8K0WSF6_9HYPO|nr:hypothetical protein B0I35DRAFT_477333 [Stachybotrys elegans]